MKQVAMTPKEFKLFQQLAKFFFDFTVSSGTVVVMAQAHELEHLGY